MSVRKCVALATLLVALYTGTASADLIYRETFGRPLDTPTGNMATSNFDWARFLAAGGGAGANGVSFDGTGKPTDVANTASAGPHSDGSFTPYAKGWTFQDSTIRLTMTPEFSFDPANYQPGTVAFSWYQGNALLSGNPQPTKLAVQVGGQWYASAANFTNPFPVTAGANFGNPDDGSATSGSSLVSTVYDPTAANWLTLNFTGSYDVTTNTVTPSGVALTLGAAPGANLSGPITAFGLYRDATGANARYDTFEINATPIPEPSTVVLACTGLVGLALLRLRRTV